MKIFVKLLYHYKIPPSFSEDFFTNHGFISCHKTFSFLIKSKILIYWETNLNYLFQNTRSALFFNDNILLFNDSDNLTSFQGSISLKELIKRIE